MRKGGGGEPEGCRKHGHRELLFRCRACCNSMKKHAPLHVSMTTSNGSQPPEVAESLPNYAGDSFMPGPVHQCHDILIRKCCGSVLPSRRLVIVLLEFLGFEVLDWTSRWLSHE